MNAQGIPPQNPSWIAAPAIWTAEINTGFVRRTAATAARESWFSV